MAIHHWAEEHRPREKLLQHGPSALSDAELLAIWLRTGVSGQSALDLAKDLLGRFGGLSDMARAGPQTLMRQKGLGPGKTAEWLACLEIGQRALREALVNRDVFCDSESTERYLISRLRHRTHETFVALFLTQANQLISDEDLFVGTVNEAAVYPRDLLRRALELNACAVIVAHNHPAGTLQASMADIDLTERLIRALEVVGIALLDHIIVAGPRALSLRRTTPLFQRQGN